MTEYKEEIVDALKQVYDPEIPINVYDLGLIYNVDFDEGKSKVDILMTLTSPTCPTAEYIQESIKEAVESLDFVSKVDVELTFEPKWTPDKVSMEAKEELGLDTEPTEDVAVSNTFSTVNEPIKEKTCFNCGNTEREFPVFHTYYKGESTYICTKCISKF